MPSPFYTDSKFQFAWNSSSLGALKDCPRKYYYLYIEGWASRGESLHLRFGKLYHRALEVYDKLRVQGADHEEALDKIVSLVLEETWDDRKFDGDKPIIDTGKPWDTSEFTAGAKKNRETLVRSVVWYLEHYKNDPAKTLILGNGEPALELMFKVETNIMTPTGEPYILSGRMDRLVEYGEDILVMDRKTTGGGIGSYYFNKFNPDNQMSTYTFAARVVYNVPVAGVIIDAAQLAVGYTNFARSITARSRGQIEDWLSDTGYWLKQAERFAEENYWPMNDQSCHKYDGCAFRDVCNKDPAVRKFFLDTQFERSTHNIDRILDPEKD